MAEKPSSPVSDLADLVTCSICLVYFKDARALPCLHSYCKDCLQGLITPQGKITCPHCRLEVHVPNGDVSTLNPNFFVSNVLDVLNSTTNVTSEERQETSPRSFCKIHPEKEYELFCEHCSKLICYKCISNWGTCGQHKYQSIETTVKVERKNVEDFLQKQEVLLPSVKKHLGVLEDMKIKQTGKVFEVNEQISDTFAKHTESLKKREEMLIKQAFDLHDCGLTLEVDRVQLEQAKIENTIEFCRKILDVDDPALFLQKYTEVKDEVFQTDTLDLVSHVELGNLHFQATDSLLADVISNFGNIVAHDEAGATKDDKQFQSTSKLKRSPTSERQANEQKPARPVGQQPVSKPQAAATVGTVTWKLYNKSHSNPDVNFENEGLAVTTKSLKNVAVIGKPGFQRGKHSWKIKVTGFPDGFSIGVCVGTYGHGIAVTYDSGLSYQKKETHINVELDCKAEILSILPDVNKQPDVIGFKNPTNCEIHPYFYLPGSGKTTHNKIAIVSMDGKEVENNDSSCCMM